MQGTPEKPQGSLRTLRFRLEVLCEVQFDSEGLTVLGVKSSQHSVGVRPGDKPSKKDVQDIAANKKALAELAAFTVIEKSHQERNALIVDISKKGAPPDGADVA